jgi:hypothetical protein
MQIVENTKETIGWVLVIVAGIVLFGATIRLFMYGSEKELSNAFLNTVSHTGAGALLAIFATLNVCGMLHMGKISPAFWQQNPWYWGLPLFVLQWWWFFLIARVYAFNHPTDHGKICMAYAINILVGVLLVSPNSVINQLCERGLGELLLIPISLFALWALFVAFEKE